MFRILIIDDNPDWRKTLKGLFDDAGYQVTTAGNEAEALMAAVQTWFDLAVIDVRLHGDDEDDSGISLALALKKLAPQMKQVLLTDFPTRADQVVKSIRFVGVANFVEKSGLTENNRLDLVGIVEEILSEPVFEPELSHLSLSFEPGHPITVRGRGAHVCSRRTKDALQLSALNYNRRAQEARAAPNPRFNIKDIGQSLYRDIFANCQEVLISFVAARTGREPLCLSFEGARDCMGIPFEFIFLDQPEEYLVLEHPLVRFINGVVPRRKALSPHVFVQLKDTLRILLVASNTKPNIPGVDQEIQQLADFLKKQQRYVNVQVNLIPTEAATLAHVRKEIKDYQPHILHYAGHGQYNEASPEKKRSFLLVPPRSPGIRSVDACSRVKRIAAGLRSSFGLPELLLRFHYRQSSRFARRRFSGGSRCRCPCWGPLSTWFSLARLRCGCTKTGLSLL